MRVVCAHQLHAGIHGDLRMSTADSATTATHTGGNMEDSSCLQNGVCIVVCDFGKHIFVY